LKDLQKPYLGAVAIEATGVNIINDTITNLQDCDDSYRATVGGCLRAINASVDAQYQSNLVRIDLAIRQIDEIRVSLESLKAPSNASFSDVRQAAQRELIENFIQHLSATMGDDDASKRARAKVIVDFANRDETLTSAVEFASTDWTQMKQSYESLRQSVYKMENLVSATYLPWSFLEKRE